MASQRQILKDVAFGAVVVAGIVYGSRAVSGGGGTQQYRFLVRSDSTVGLSYRVHVENEPSMDTDAGDDSAEDNDSIVERPDGTWDIRGTTGSASGDQPFGDTFTWEATGGNGILGFQASLPSSDYSLFINESATDPDSLPDYSPPDDGNGGDPSEEPLGGGSGYGDTFTASDADFIAGTASELSGALSQASSGDVVFVESDVAIDGLDVPAGVTVAGDRGVGGSSGARIESSASRDDAREVLYLHDGARLTGLRIMGPFTSVGAGVWGFAIRGAGGGDFEVDNCELAYWGEGNVTVGEGNHAHVHHCYHHHTDTDGFGYGVSSSDDRALIEYNYFHSMRHAVTAPTGGDGYVVRYNHFSPTQRHGNVDAHDPGGVADAEVHNNIFEYTGGGITSRVVQIGGTASVGYWVYDNWFFSTVEPDVGQEGGGNAIVRFDDTHGGSTISWDGISFVAPPTIDRSTDSNVYGSDALSSYDQVIPGHPGTTPW